nr:hypothetical protein [Tanacetum cinerariifolium]
MLKKNQGEQHYYQQYKFKIKFEREQRIAKEKVAEQEAKDAELIEQMEDVQARMDADVLLAKRLQQEEREKFTINEQARMLVDLIAERKRFFASQRTKQIRNKPPTRTQLRNKMRRQPTSGGCLAAAGGLRCGGGAWRELTYWIG